MGVQHPLSLVARPGEDIQYGYRKVVEGEDSGESSTDVTPVDVKGKEPEKSIPAILRYWLSPGSRIVHLF